MKLLIQDRVFISALNNLLVVHIQSKMNSYEFICDYCSRSFTRKYNLQNHIENFHLNSPCTCHVCHRKFVTPSGYHLHMSRGHNRKGTSFPECDLCGRIFTRRQNIVSHMNTVHLQSVTAYFRCELCNKYFTTEWSLKRHSHQIHNQNYTSCSLCKKVFKRQDGLDSHIQTCHRRGIKQCTICDKSYANNRNLKRHIKSSHMTPKTEKPEHTGDNEEPSTSMADPINSDSDDLECNFVCSFCNEDFLEEKNLRQHIKTKHSFQSFHKYCRNALLTQMNQSNQLTQQTTEDIICDFCKTVSKNLDDFTYHMKTNHRNVTSVYTCNVCFVKFYSKGAIQDHQKICKPPDKVHSCSHCSKLFTEKTSLEFHIKTFHPHTQIADSNITSTIEETYSFKCKYCDRIYYSKRALNQHIKLKHLSLVPIKCELCDKVCSNKYYYKRHFKIVHHNTTTLQCDYCDKQFKSKKNIRRHIQFTHLGKQQYNCIVCDSMFKEQRSLRKHIRGKHADSDLFPQCNICCIRFESTKSCNIHQKLFHSMHQCHICTASFNSDAALNNHLLSEHLNSENVYQCDKCSRAIVGKDNFEYHIKKHDNTSKKRNPKPHCIICTKDFSTRKSLKRHINKFHAEFDLNTLIGYCNKGMPKIECEECLKNLNDERYWSIYQNIKDTDNTKVFKCEYCKSSYKPFEYAIQRYKTRFTKIPYRKYLKTFVPENTILSELCTTEMSDDENCSEFGKSNEIMEAESTTADIKLEPPEEISGGEIKSEPVSP